MATELSQSSRDDGIARGEGEAWVGVEPVGGAVSRSWRVILRDRWVRTALVLWSLLALASSVKVVLSPHRQHFTFFRLGSIDWFAGRPLLENELGLYRYGPPFAILTSPFSFLPPPWGNILWNLVTLVALAAAVVALARHVLPGRWVASEVGLLLVLTLPGVIRGVWSSQSHGISAACIFFALALMARGRWWSVALLLGLAFWTKLAPIVVGLLLCLVRPRALTGRYLVAVAGLGLLPFLTQAPTYVVGEYGSWIGHLTQSADRRWISFRDFHYLWEQTGLPFDPTLHLGIQLVAAAAIAALVLWLSRSRLERGSLLTLCGALGAAYMLLFGPAVEFNQYVLIAPFLAWAVIATRGSGRPRLFAGALWLLVLVLGFGQVSRSLAPLGVAWVSAAPVAGTLAFAVWLARRAWIAGSAGARELALTGTVSR